jgi:type IV pilus assembly protein PilA
MTTSKHTSKHSSRNISRHQPSHQSGFTLVELLIVMSVILILMTLAIPKLMSTMKNANQTSAIASVRDLVSQETSYASSYPQHGFACTLAQLGGKAGSGAPSADSAQLIADDLATGNKSGYTFSIICGTKQTVNNVDQVNSYEITAVPNSVGHTGDRGYCASDDGEIRYDPKGGTNCTEILQ